MSEKISFTFLIRPDERHALRNLAKADDRSQSATLRRLIRLTARERGLLPTDGYISSKGIGAEELQHA